MPETQQLRCLLGGLGLEGTQEARGQEEEVVRLPCPSLPPTGSGRNWLDPEAGGGGDRNGGPAHTHPEHLPQVGVPEPEGDVGDVEPLGVLLLCGVGGRERLAVRLCRLVRLLWGEDRVRASLSSTPRGRGSSKTKSLPAPRTLPPGAGICQGNRARHSRQHLGCRAAPPGVCPAVP